MGGLHEESHLWCLSIHITPWHICPACLGILEGFCLELFAFTAVFLSQAHCCHIYHPCYVIDDTVLQLQPSARGKSVLFVDVAELFTGCDMKLSVMQ